MAEPTIDLITPFLGYLIIADGAIHTAELAVLADLIAVGTLSTAAQDEMTRIVADAADKIHSQHTSTLPKLSGRSLSLAVSDVKKYKIEPYLDVF